MKNGRTEGRCPFTRILRAVSTAFPPGPARARIRAGGQGDGRSVFKHPARCPGQVWYFAYMLPVTQLNLAKRTLLINWMVACL